MSKHTPGPWQYSFEGGTVAFIVESDGTTVAKLSVTMNSTAHSKLAANARLIAAAPELLEALKAVVAIAKEAHAHWDAHRDYKVGNTLLALAGANEAYDKRIDAIHAAIAKAEGHKEEKITDNHVHLKDDETVCDHCFRKESNCMCSDYDIDADFGDK